jgi:hypothetical protein
MSQSELKEIDKDKLPWVYRLILKIPGVDFLENTSSGVFWSLIAPVFLVLEFFLNFYLLLFFPFPVNVILTLIIPAIVLLVFLRISLERFINWWNLTLGEHRRKWDVEKTVQEYLVLLEKKKKKQ